jgi:hypothetical protein
MQKFVGETALWRGRSAREIIQWMIFSEGRAAAPGKERFPPRPHPQSAQVRFMRTLLVSDDLTADLISATGGNRRFVPFRESHKEDWRAFFMLPLH